MKRLFYISLLFLITSFSSEASIYFENEKNDYIAGEDVILNFCFDVLEVSDQFDLLAHHGFGVIQVNGVVNKPYVTFNIPKSITSKSGVLTLRIFQNKKMIYAKDLDILPIPIAEKLESYCGPKHLVIDRNDYAMMVSTVLDSLDNPLPENTTVHFNYQHGDQLTKSEKKTRKLYAYQRFEAQNKIGYGTITANYDNISEKAFRVDYYAHDPVGFSISYDRQHQYADGEQLVYLQTDKIQDRFGNVIGNGTLVKFIIRNQAGEISELYGQTIDGVAKGLKYAPNTPNNWTVTAIIPNFAESKNTLDLSFRPSIKGFEIQFLNHDEIVVGPIVGYLNQLVQNGKSVKITIKNSEETLIIERQTTNGHVSLSLKNLRLAKGEYEITATIAGITKNSKLNY